MGSVISVIGATPSGVMATSTNLLPTWSRCAKLRAASGTRPSTATASWGSGDVGLGPLRRSNHMQAKNNPTTMANPAPAVVNESIFGSASRGVRERFPPRASIGIAICARVGGASNRRSPRTGESDSADGAAAPPAGLTAGSTCLGAGCLTGACTAGGVSVLNESNGSAPSECGPHIISAQQTAARRSFRRVSQADHRSTIETRGQGASSGECAPALSLGRAAYRKLSGGTARSNAE